MDQHFGFSTTDGQLVTVEESAILIIETESVATGEGDTGIGLTKEKQIPILQDQRIGRVSQSALGLLLAPYESVCSELSRT